MAGQTSREVSSALSMKLQQMRGPSQEEFRENLEKAAVTEILLAAMSRGTVMMIDLNFQAYEEAGVVHVRPTMETCPGTCSGGRSAIVYGAGPAIRDYMNSIGAEAVFDASPERMAPSLVNRGNRRGNARRRRSCGRCPRHGRGHRMAHGTARLSLIPSQIARLRALLVVGRKLFPLCPLPVLLGFEKKARSPVSRRCD